MTNILICFGTRPEYIKVKSLIDNLPNIKTCFTGQHKDLLNNINADFKLDINDEISENRLNNIICNIMKYSEIFDNIDYVLVQGDTTTACAMALSAFNHGKKVIHLEAGLRSGDPKDPYPEEMNRQIISRIADIHLCPTEFNKQNLEKENVSDKIYVVGNTGLDNINDIDCEYKNQVLITMHRRDNHDIMDQWFNEIEIIANKYPNIEFMIPLHPNPNVQKHKHIFKKVKVCEPMSHTQIIDYLKKCKFVISDSGGLQEECSYLNKKIIVCRKKTDRPETIGINSIICEKPEKLEEIINNIITNFEVNAECPYGDGKSWKKIKKVFIKNNIIKSNPKIAYFLCDYTYNISHILLFCHDKKIKLIYITELNKNNNFQLAENNDVLLYKQECCLKHIISLGINFDLIFLSYNDINKFIDENKYIYIFLNYPKISGIDYFLNENNINFIFKNDILENKLNINVNKYNILKNTGHGFDEENLVSKSIVEKKYIDFENYLTISKKIVNFSEKKNIFNKIYNVDLNKKTIIFFDNYLHPFLTTKSNEYEKSIFNNLVKILIRLKKDYNVILRFHPFNEYGINVGKEFPDIIFSNFIINFTPFENFFLYDICDIIISNRYTSTGFESIFSDKYTIFIDYDINLRNKNNLLFNYLKQYSSNEEFYSLNIIKKDIIPIFLETNINEIINFIENKLLYKNHKKIDEYLKKSFII